MNILDFAGPIEIKHRNPDCVITTSSFLSQPQIDRFLLLKFHLQSPLIAEFDIGTWQSKKVQTSETHITFTHTLSINIYTHYFYRQAQNENNYLRWCFLSALLVVHGGWRGFEEGEFVLMAEQKNNIWAKENFDIYKKKTSPVGNSCSLPHIQE